METYRIKVNEGYTVRTESLNGQEHIVIPVIMMREGVHSGSHGAIYHRAQDLGQYVESWNGIPVTIGHPVQDNQSVSANSPEIREAWVVGTIYNAHMVGEALHAEAWILPVDLTRISPSAEEMINNGQPMDVSVGVFSDSIEEEGEWNGETYHSIATNYRPDHLALLPHEQGACSFTDGCGVRTNKTSINTSKQNDDEKMDVKTFKAKAKELIPLQVNQDYTERAETLQRMLDNMDTDGRYHWLDALFEDHFFYRVSGRRVRNGKQFFQQTYTLDENDQITFTGQPVEVRRNVEYVPITPQINKKFKRTKNNSKMKKEDKVSQLINHKASGWCESDQEFLMALPDERLDNFVAALPEETPQTNKKEEPKKETPQVNALDELTPEQLIAKLPQNVQDSIQHGLTAYNNQKAKLIEVITNGQGENGAWTKEELAVFNNEKLEKIAAPYLQANAGSNEGGTFDYSLLGTNGFKQPQQPQNNDDLGTPMMPVNYEQKKD